MESAARRRRLPPGMHRMRPSGDDETQFGRENDCKVKRFAPARGFASTQEGRERQTVCKHPSPVLGPLSIANNGIEKGNCISDDHRLILSNAVSSFN